MTVFRIETETEGREVYCVEADSEEQAREKLERGEGGQPIVAEVTGSSIETVTPCASAQDC